MSDCCSVEHPHTVESPNMHQLPNDGSPHWLKWTIPIEPDTSQEDVARMMLGDGLYELVVYDSVTEEDSGE